MVKKIKYILSLKKIGLLLSVMIVLNGFSEDNHHEHEEKKEGKSITEEVQHHIADSHVIDIYSNEGGVNIELPLPIILIDNGVKVFMSSSFEKVDHHGNKYAKVGDAVYANVHEKIYKLNAGQEELELDAEHHPKNAEKVLDLSITKNVFSMILSVLILLILFVPAASKYKKNGLAPKGMQNLLEVFVVYVRDEIAIPNIGEKKYKKFLPFLLTVFFFVWVNNLLGLIPFFPGSANLTGNIAFTMVMAVITYLVTTFSGTKDYWGHIFWMPGIPVPMRIIMAPIELIGTLTKPVALMIRLCANISAGHIIILSLVLGLGVASFPMALFMDVLELLVAFLQAYVFTLLSALFIGQAVEEHDHHEAHH